MRPVLRLALVAAASLPTMIAACAPDDKAAPPVRPTPQPKAASNERCLLAAWSRQPVRDVTFDRAHDLVEGGSIACATETTARRFQVAIADLQGAAARQDRARLADLAGLPLTYIDMTGERRTLSTRSDLQAQAERIFDAEVCAALAAMSVDRMAVADGGGSFRLGAIWLAARNMGGDPVLVTINRQALRESAAAAAASPARP